MPRWSLRRSSRGAAASSAARPSSAPSPPASAPPTPAVTTKHRPSSIGPPRPRTGSRIATRRCSSKRKSRARRPHRRRPGDARPAREGLADRPPDHPRRVRSRRARDRSRQRGAGLSAPPGRRAIAHPEHGLARPSITRLARHAEEKGGTGAALAWLRGVAPAFRGTEQEQVAQYGIATELDRAGDLRRRA